jgi:hypothetical protein
VPGYLRDIEQRFTADATGYLAAIREIIGANRRFAVSVDSDVLQQIAKIRTELGSLPDSATIRVTVDTAGALAGIARVKAALDDLPAARDITITTRYVTVGDVPRETGDVTRTVTTRYVNVGEPGGGGAAAAAAGAAAGAGSERGDAGLAAAAASVAAAAAALAATGRGGGGAANTVAQDAAALAMMTASRGGQAAGGLAMDAAMLAALATGRPGGGTGGGGVPPVLPYPASTHIRDYNRVIDQYNAAMAEAAARNSAMNDALRSTERLSGDSARALRGLQEALGLVQARSEGMTAAQKLVADSFLSQMDGWDQLVTRLGAAKGAYAAIPEVSPPVAMTANDAGVLNKILAATEVSADGVTRVLGDAASASLLAQAAAGSGAGAGGRGIYGIGTGGGGGDGGGGGLLAFLSGGGGLSGRIFGGAAPAVQAAHLTTMFAMEAASTIIPAMVAGIAAAAVSWQGAQAAYLRGQGIYTAGEALGGAYGVTPGQLFGMAPGFQVAQDQATGGVYGIIGGLMSLAGQGTGQGGILGPGGLGVQTVAMIDRAIANISPSRMGQAAGALGGGTGYLRSFGDIGANLVDTLLNLAPVMPGMGPLLLGGLKGVTGVLRSVTGLTGGGGLWPLLFGTGLAAEAGWRWGGLALSGGKLPFWLGGRTIEGLAGLAGRLGLGATSMTAEEAAAAAGLSTAEYAGIGGGAVSGTGLAGFLEAGIGGLPIAAITALLGASAYGISQGQFGTPAAQQMGGFMRSINASFGASSLTSIIPAMGQASRAEQHPPGVSFDTIGGAAVPVGVPIGELVRRGYTPRQALAQLQGEYAANVKNVADQLGQMTAAGPQAVKALSDLGVKGASLSQAFDLMTMAMISPKDIGPGGVLGTTAVSQLRNFIKAYSVMTGGTMAHASALLSAASAKYIMSAPQMTSLAQVNQALDSMTQIMTGGPANAAALYQTALAAPALVAQAMATAPGGRLSTAQQNQVAGALAGNQKAADALMAQALTNIFTPGGAAAWTQFAGPQGIIAASQQNMDQLRTFMTLGGITSGQAAGLGAFELQQYLPYAAQSPMALAMVLQQGMQAGIPGLSMGMNYAQASKAIRAAAVGSAQANAIMTRGVQAVADIPGVANFLNPQANVSPMQAALYAQMAQHGMAAAEHPTLGNVQALMGSLAMSGVQPGQMKIAVDAILRNLHVPPGIVAKVNAEIDPASMRSQLAAIKDKNIQIRAQASTAAAQAAVNAVKGKNVIITASTTAAQAQAAINAIHGKTANITVTAPNVGAVQAAIDAIHGKNVTVTITYVTQGLPGAQQASFATVTGSGQYTAYPVKAAQSGFKVPGYGGGDIWGPAMLEPGELVVPKHMVAAGAVDHLRGRIPGFAAGGVAGLPISAMPAGGPPAGRLQAEVNAAWRQLDILYAEEKTAAGQMLARLKAEISRIWASILDPLYAELDAARAAPARHGHGHPGHHPGPYASWLHAYPYLRKFPHLLPYMNALSTGKLDFPGLPAGTVPPWMLAELHSQPGFTPAAGGSVNVNVNVSTGTIGGLSEADVKTVTEKIQAGLLKQARRNPRTGLQLRGKGA